MTPKESRLQPFGLLLLGPGHVPCVQGAAQHNGGAERGSGDEQGAGQESVCFNKRQIWDGEVCERILF